MSLVNLTASMRKYMLKEYVCARSNRIGADENAEHCCAGYPVRLAQGKGGWENSQAQFDSLTYVLQVTGRRGPSGPMAWASSCKVIFSQEILHHLIDLIQDQRKI